MRESIEDTADREPFQELVVTTYYDDQLDVETVSQLVGAEIDQRLRRPKLYLEDGQLHLAPEAA